MITKWIFTLFGTVFPLKKLHKLYNNSVIFHKRWNRLKNSKTIIITKKEVNIKTLKVKILLNFFFIIKKLFG